MQAEVTEATAALARPLERLSQTLPEFLASGETNRLFDVLIVGSGYGGSVAAHVLAAVAAAAQNTALRVLLLERGREYFVDDFPGTFGELPRELRLGHQTTGEVANPEGLFDVRMGDDVAVMVANGLGGGSLINAGVMLVPDPEQVASAPLKKRLADLVNGNVYTRAIRLLGGQVKREGHWVSNDITRLHEAPRKSSAFERVASDRAETMRPVEITVALDRGPNFAGTVLEACNRCGDCMTGCKVGAKDSLDRNLLVLAKRALGSRLTIVTGVTVSSLGRDQFPIWFARVQHTDARLQQREGFGLRVKAKNVVLAAGALGSPEILMRSRSDLLMFSNRLGESFSGNGDDIAAIHRLPDDVHGAADETIPRGLRDIGPTTTARVTLTPKGFRPFQLEEFSIPGPMRRLFEEVVTTGYMFTRLPKWDCTVHRPGDDDPLAVDPKAMLRTLLVGVVGHDDANGSLRLSNPNFPEGGVPQMGAVRIHWPRARWGGEFDAAHKRVESFAESAHLRPFAKRPTLVTNPMWRLLPEGLGDLVTHPRGPVLTVHPLGGCGIGSSVADGVVDECGRVFDASPARHDAWQGSLVVLDGSIVGASLGVNPALTITALSLAAMDELCSDWNIGNATRDPTTEADKAALPGKDRLVPAPPPAPVPAPPAPQPQRARTVVAVTERLWGAVSLRGPIADAVVELTLAFKAQPIATMIGPQRVPIELDEAHSVLRIYDSETWHSHHLAAADDLERHALAVFEAHLQGTQRFLHRGKTGPLGRTLRGLRAWACNRGVRDTWQRVKESKTRRSEQAAHGVPVKKGLLEQGLEFARLASHAGQVRLFDYRLGITAIAVDKGGWSKLLPAGTAIDAEKRLGYGRRANPWHQMTRLHLTKMPGLHENSVTLKLDPRFLARQGTPLLKLTQQHDHAEALAELLCFGLYLMRVLITGHLWSFRKPDRFEPREIKRLPQKIGGLPLPEFTDLVVDRWRADRDDDTLPFSPVTIRLTHYPTRSGAKPGRPLVMLHGYSASGTTFTHPSLGEDAAAAWFWHKGRDVWVVDLRTSCGLPSARLPWSMEQAGLVDIPAALLHIKSATGQKVDVLAHCIGGAMLGMALLGDEQAVRSGAMQLGVDSWLTAYHLGNLSLFNGDDPQGGAHPTVHRIVLSQKGPVMRYTDANLLRAFVLQYARRWFFGDDYSFQTSSDPGVSEQLLDRFLSSLPYEDGDFDVENPRWPCATTPWTATRHRMDALFGRVFTAANLRPETLHAIDDLFGPINLDTVSQTIHFARFDAITNQRGRGEFVTRERIRQRWGGIKTMALHGADNGLVAPHTQQLLRERLGEAGVPLVTPPPEPGMGHQDCLIGTGAPRVFAKIEAFLADPAEPPAVAAQASKELVMTAAWLGPRLVLPAPASDDVVAATMSRPDQGQAVLWLVPVRRRALGTGLVDYEIASDVPGAWARSPRPADSLHWSRAAVPMVGWPIEQGAEPGWLAGMVYELGECSARLPRGPGFPETLGAGEGAGKQPGSRAALGVPPRRHLIDAPGIPLSHTVRLRTGPLASLLGQAATTFRSLPTPATGALTPVPAEVIEAAHAWLETLTLEEADAVFIARDDVVRTRSLAEPQATLRFAVGSCQYPHGLFDRGPAAASLTALARLQEPAALALLIGDQIYADATAGLTDPTRRDERYDLPHQRAFRAEGLRHVMRRLPVQMLLDDHELVDNWQPLPALPADNRRVREERKVVKKALERGVAAFNLYQRMEHRKLASPPPRQDLRFTAAGYPFYLLDTRTGRWRSSPSVGPVASSIVDADQMLALQQWLLAHPKALKFIATPSLLLPRRTQSLHSESNACLSDAWDGFPPSLGELLGFIASKGIERTVFLSGDEHHSLHAEVWIEHQGLKAKVLSIHSSALYAPYPFANGQPHQLAMNDSFSIGPLAVTVRAKSARSGDGFALVKATNQASAGHLTFNYAKGDGSLGNPITLALS